MSTEIEKTLSARDLRRRWKPHKERLNRVIRNHPTPIRFHRACSWLARVEESDTDDPDFALIGLWVAFNSLYGRWDEQRHEPQPDRETYQGFVSRLLGMDQSQHIASLLTEHRRLVMSLLEDEYLSKFFWKDPCGRQAGKSRRVKLQAQSWYHEKRWAMILDHVIDRVYLMRCQLVHGAATFGSSLNRTSLQHCVWMMRHLLTTFLLVWIEQGANEDWGPMCYPPLTSVDSGGTPKNPR